jgi:hypothetical protein
MAAERRTLWLAVALVGVLVVAGIVWTSGGSTPSPTGVTSAQTPRAQGRGAAAGEQTAPGPVRLDALKVHRAEPGDAERNPFRFEQRAVAQPAVTMTTPAAKPANESAFSPITRAVPAGPPSPPPIPLKFIGLVQQGSTKVAVLSDGKSAPVSGKEGAIILGQYRILKIGEESIEMAYVDGRGRQTIRLTGQ